MTETSTLLEPNEDSGVATEEPVSFCGSFTATTVPVDRVERSGESPEDILEPADLKQNDRHNQGEYLQSPRKLPVDDMANSSLSPGNAFPSSPAIGDNKHPNDSGIGCEEPPILKTPTKTPSLSCVPVTSVLASNIHQQQPGSIPEPSTSNGSLPRAPVMKRPRHKPGERRELLERAVEDVLTLNISMRRAAQKHNLAKSSLCDYVRKNKIPLPNLRFKSLPNNQAGSTATPSSANTSVAHTHSTGMKRTASDVTLDPRSDSHAQFSSIPAKMVCSTINRVLAEHENMTPTPISYSEGEDTPPDRLLKPTPPPSISCDLLNHHHRASPMNSTGGQLEPDYLFGEAGQQHRLFLQQSPVAAATAAAVAISRTSTPSGQASLAKSGRIESPWHNAAGLPTQVPIRSWSGLSGSCAAVNNTGNNNNNLLAGSMTNPDKKTVIPGGGRHMPGSSISPACVHPTEGLGLSSSTSFPDIQHRDIFSPVVVAPRKPNPVTAGCDTDIQLTCDASRLETEGGSDAGLTEASASEHLADKNAVATTWSDRSYTLASGGQGYTPENTSVHFEECHKNSLASCSQTDTANSYHSDFSTGLGTNRSSPVVGLSQLHCSSTEQPPIPSVFPNLNIRQQLSRGDSATTVLSSSSQQQDYSSGQLTSDSHLPSLSVGGLLGSVQASSAALDASPISSSCVAQSSHGCVSLPSILSNSSNLQSFIPATIAALLYQQSRNSLSATHTPAFFGCVNRTSGGQGPQHQHHPYTSNTCQLPYSSSSTLPAASQSASILPDLTTGLSYSSLAALTAGLPHQSNPRITGENLASLNPPSLTDLTSLSELLQNLKPDDLRPSNRSQQTQSTALPVQSSQPPKVSTQELGNSQLTALLVGLLLHHWSSQSSGHPKTPGSAQPFNGQLNSQSSGLTIPSNSTTPASQLPAGFDSTPSLEMSQQAEAFIDFINKSPSPFHVVQTACELLTRHGFRELKETDAWTVSRGDRVFVIKNGTTLVAAAIGGKFEPGNGMNIIGAHTDSPCLRLKPVSERLKEGYVQVGVEAYGGGMWYSWFDRELKVAGRVLVTDPATRRLQQRLVHIDQPIACVPSLAIHLDKDLNSKGFHPNNELHLGPILCTSIIDQLRNDPGPGQPTNTAVPEAKRSHPIALIRLIAKHLGVDEKDVVELELYFADSQPAQIGGIHQEFIHAPRQDNLFNCYAGLQGLFKSLDSLDGDSTMRMVCLYDHEEVGSMSAQGADSGFTTNTLRRLVNAMDYKPLGDTVECFEQSLGRSFLISADQSHAVHPSYVDRYEDEHKPQIHGGVVLKYNTNQAYATNSLTAAVLRRIAEFGGTHVQEYINRQDMPCGTTIGPILSAQLGVATVDVGFPQLAMHSCRELGSVHSVEMAVKLYSTFFEKISSIWPLG